MTPPPLHNPDKVFEPLLSGEGDRLTLFPLKYPDVWKLYKKAEAAVWSVGEIDLSSDIDDWEKRLNESDRHFVETVLAFFASADRIVNQNLAERFCREVDIYEVQCFYDLQKFMENVHSEMYSVLIETFVKDAVKKNHLFDAVQEMDCIARKARWAQRWMNETKPFPLRLLAFAVVEGIFFSGSFCAIYWLKQRKLMPGLCASNALIARDEGMHQEFAVFLYRRYVKERPSNATIYGLVDEAVQHEVNFCCEALPVSLVGMSSEHMSEYIRFVADRFLTDIGVPKLYSAVNPFDWMEMISLDPKTNFFEHRVTEYKKAGSAGSRLDSDREHEGFDTTAEF